MKTVPILMYHSLASDAGYRFRQFTLSPALFREHLQYLSENHYTPITVTRLAGMMRAGEASLPQHPVVITFDDGFMDFYDSAVPVLGQYSFTATVYIVTGFVEGSSRWLRPEGEENRKMLAWSQILEIDRAGIECGPHSHTHADLDILSEDSARREIALSKEVLEQKLGHPVSTFCYPYGHYDGRVRDMVEQAGFEAACAVRNALSHPGDNRFSLARITIGSRTTARRLASLLSGTGLQPAEDRDALITKTWRSVRKLRHAWQS